MTVKECMQHYHKLVPFPISVKKIRAAGFNTTDYLGKIKKDLEDCVDYDQPLVVEVIQTIRKMQKVAIS